MELAGNIVSVFLISLMSWQDFKTRSITAWLLPAIGICFLAGEISVLSTDVLFRNAMVNWTLLVLQFFLLWIWISARNGKWISIVDTQIGLGDILLLVCLAPAFSPVNFFLFYTCGAIFALAVALVYRKISVAHDSRIPLAGLLGLPLVLVCALRAFDPTLVLLTNDQWIINILLPQ
jgi:hypothetical protein